MTRAGRLLLVDDDPDIRLVARIGLERLGGWEVVEADRGETAVALARAQPPDVVLLDVMMPGVDGPGTLELLRPVIGADTPVIFLTAKTQATDRERLVRLGAAGFIAKPFDPLKLADEVAAWVAGAVREDPPPAH